MKLAIMQPYFFPYIGYFQSIQAVDTFVIYDRVGYIKKGWMNRNRLLRVKDGPLLVTAPVKRQGRSGLAHEVTLAGTNWRQRLLKTIKHNYCRRPHFREIYSMVADILFFDTESLCALNIKGIVEICKFLDISTHIQDSTGFEAMERLLAREEIDLCRVFPHLSLPTPTRKVFRILEMCRILEADTFVNAIGGQTLYDKSEFAKNQVDLFFVKTLPISYRQSTETFHPNLSIIDVLMNCGKHGTKEILNRYELI